MTRIADPIAATTRPLTITSGAASGSPIAALFSGAAEAPATGLFALLLQEAAPSVSSAPVESGLPQPVRPPLHQDKAGIPPETVETVAATVLPRALPLPAGPTMPEAVALPVSLPITGGMPAVPRPWVDEAALALQAPPLTQAIGEVAAEIAPAPGAAGVSTPVATRSLLSTVSQPGAAQIGIIIADHTEPDDTRRLDTTENEAPPQEIRTQEIPVSGPGVPPVAIPPLAAAKTLPHPGTSQPRAAEQQTAPLAPAVETGFAAQGQPTDINSGPASPATTTTAEAARGAEGVIESPKMGIPTVNTPLAQPATAPARTDRPTSGPSIPAPAMARVDMPQPPAAPHDRAPLPAASFADRPGVGSPEAQPQRPDVSVAPERQSAMMPPVEIPETAPQPAPSVGEEEPMTMAAPAKTIKIEAEIPKAISPAPMTSNPVSSAPVSSMPVSSGPVSSISVSPVPLSAVPTSPGLVVQNAGKVSANPLGSAAAVASSMANKAVAGIAAKAVPPADAGADHPAATSAAPEVNISRPVTARPTDTGGDQPLHNARPNGQGDAAAPETAPPPASPAQAAPAATAPQTSTAPPLPLPTDPPPAATMTAPLGPLETERPEWQADLVSRITARIEEQGAVFDIALTPETLGAVEVRLEVRDGKADVTFVTETREAARLLAQSEAKLGELLARSGVSLNSQDASARDQAQSQPRPDRSPLSRTGKQDDAPATPPSVSTRRSGLNLIA